MKKHTSEEEHETQKNSKDDELSEDKHKDKTNEKYKHIK